MGQDKAFMSMGNQKMYEVVSNVLSSCGINQHYFVGNSTLKPCIEDKVPHRGPLGGVYSFVDAVLNHDLRFQYALFLAVDMPLLNAEVIVNILRYRAY
ncbi:MAG TPA: NTP transferase domain-containing protein, partial [Gammaproteobacteria bacterium]|nr:NTP transferase domain-containing protein [Gammaproteobacteria bacterium]